RAGGALAPPAWLLRVSDGLGPIRLSNPDLEPAPPQAARELRLAVSAASALIIASPEYAHGVSSVIKNALDWLVSHEGVVNKPIALVNTSPRAHHAYDALREVLQTMSTVIVAEASATLPLLGSYITEEAMLASPEVRQSIRGVLAALAAYLSDTGAAAPSFPIA